MCELTLPIGRTWFTHGGGGFVFWGVGVVSCCGVRKEARGPIGNTCMFSSRTFPWWHPMRFTVARPGPFV